MRKSILLILAFCLASSIVAAGSFEFRGATDKLNLYENMGSVLETVTVSQLADLKGGSVATKEGTTSYNQFLRFKDSTTALNTSLVFFGENSQGDVGEFLKVTKGTAVTDAFFEWQLSFQDGLKSKINDKRLDSLDDAKVSIFSDDYVIIDSNVDGKQIKLTLAKGAINDILKQGEKKVYTIGTKTYEVEVVNIDTTNNKVKFKVNSKETRLLQKGDIESIDTNTFIGVSNLISSQGNAVKLFIGATIIEIKDDNYEDDTFNRDVAINKEKVDNGFVKISAAMVSDTLKISSIKYRLLISENAFISPGDSIRTHLSKPGDMLGDWNIRFAGLETIPTNQIKFIPSPSDDEYRLEFTSSEGKLINIPFVSYKGATFKFGDSTRNLVSYESASNTDFIISKGDYFVLTTANAKSGKTYVVSYDSINTDQNTVIFTEVGGTQVTLTYTNSSTTTLLGEGTLNVGAISTKVYIESAAPNRLAIDLNGNSALGNGAMNIITKGGGILSTGASSASATISGSTDSVTLTTDSTQFEDSASTEVLTFTLQSASSTPKVNFATAMTGLTTAATRDNHILGRSNYGVKVDLLSTSNKAGSLNIDYPQSEIAAKVVIDVNVGTKVETKVEQSKEDTCQNGKQDSDETGIDCGGSCKPCPTCTDGIQNGDETGVDCGGSCPKLCPTQQAKSETCNGCWQILEQGKKNCLPHGTVVKTLYCNTAGLLVPLKNNGEACSAAYECKFGRCEDGKCGRKITAGLIVINISVIILILLILYYLFTLLK